MPDNEPEYILENVPELGGLVVGMKPCGDCTLILIADQSTLKTYVYRDEDRTIYQQCIRRDWKANKVFVVFVAMVVHNTAYVASYIAKNIEFDFHPEFMAVMVGKFVDYEYNEEYEMWMETGTNANVSRAPPPSSSIQHNETSPSRNRFSSPRMDHTQMVSQLPRCTEAPSDVDKDKNNDYRTGGADNFGFGVPDEDWDRRETASLANSVELDDFGVGMSDDGLNTRDQEAALVNELDNFGFGTPQDEVLHGEENMVPVLNEVNQGYGHDETLQNEEPPTRRCSTPYPRPNEDPQQNGFMVASDDEVFELPQASQQEPGHLNNKDHVNNVREVAVPPVAMPRESQGVVREERPVSISEDFARSVALIEEKMFSQGWYQLTYKEKHNLLMDYTENVVKVYKTDIPFAIAGPLLWLDIANGKRALFSRRLGCCVPLPEESVDTKEPYAYAFWLGFGNHPERAPDGMNHVECSAPPPCMRSQKTAKSELRSLRGIGLLCHGPSLYGNQHAEKQWRVWNDSLGYIPCIDGSASQIRKKNQTFDPCLQFVLFDARPLYRRGDSAREDVVGWEVTNMEYHVKEKMAFSHEGPRQAFTVSDLEFVGERRDDYVFRSPKMNVAEIHVNRKQMRLEGRQDELYGGVVFGTWTQEGTLLEWRLLACAPAAYWRSHKEFTQVLSMLDTLDGEK